MENFETTIVTTIDDNFPFNVEGIADINGTVTSTFPPTTAATLRLYDIFIPMLGVFIIALNLLIVISSGLVLRKGQQPRSTYLFLGNVAMADLVTGFAVLFGQFYPRKYRDEMSCAIQIGMIVSSTLTSVYSVGLIAIDRFLYILYGLQYQRFIYPTRARLLILLAWIIGLVIGFLPAMGWRGNTDNGRICWFIILAPPGLVILTTVLGLLPILLVVVLYSIILHRALYKLRQLRKASSAQGSTGAQGSLRLFRGGGNRNVGSDDSDMEQKQPAKTKWWKCCGGENKSNNSSQPTTPNKGPSQWKAIKVVFFTTGSFVITWVPFFIASFMYVHCDPNKTPEFCNSLRVAIASPLAILGFSNSLLNPIIYAWWHNGFRESVKKMYKKSCCKSCCNSRQHQLSNDNHQTQQATSRSVVGAEQTSLSRATYLSSTTSITSPTTSDVETSTTDYENRITMPANGVVDGGGDGTGHRRNRHM